MTTLPAVNAAERDGALENINVVGLDSMPTPADVHAAAPVTPPMSTGAP